MSDGSFALVMNLVQCIPRKYAKFRRHHIDTILSRFYLYARMMNSNFLLLDCGGLNSPANGAVDTTAGTTYGKTATYTCNVGFNVQGDATRLCGADGLWAGNAPICAIQGM